MPQPSSEKPPRWTLDKHLAYECALALDEQQDWQQTKEEDKAFRASLEPQEPSASDPRMLLDRWLLFKLDRHPSLASATNALRETLKTSHEAFCLVAFILGLGIAAAALAYTGSAPINVSAFFACFILLQFGLSLFLILVFILPANAKTRLLSAFWFRIGASILRKLIGWAGQLKMRFLNADHRAAAAEWSGIAQGRITVRREFFKWLAFRNLQLPAVCFNVGALLALLFAVTFSDRAFGWQTTLDADPESVHAIARGFALPWKWAYGEGLGYPSLSEIEGSRIVLKEGVGSLENQDLASWWRFLALGIATYGILPRLIARVFGSWRLRQAMNRYAFDDASSQRLLRRLIPQSALFSTSQREPKDEPPRSEPFEAPVATATSGQSAICLIDKAFAQQLDEQELRNALASSWNVAQDKIALQPISLGAIDPTALEAHPDSQYAFLVESWMPPIKETERFLQALRQTAGERSLIRVTLLGIPSDEQGNAHFSVEPEHRRTWHSFIRRMGDPYLMLDPTDS